MQVRVQVRVVPVQVHVQLCVGVRTCSVELVRVHLKMTVLSACAGTVC